jgi:isoquinoline 1-oxidoreductase alpha subunit
MISFKVNGQEKSFEGDPETPLLWYLRDIAGLTGTKFGCGEALCGACTVHVGGAAARSCQTAMSDVSGQEVVTIEGLSPNGTHPLQAAWRELNVPQCGYCQAGQIMQAADLLKNTPHPSDADIDNAMSGNICRCGTYPRIRAAIKRAAGGGV